jgi:hypothetical protein
MFRRLILLSLFIPLIPQSDLNINRYKTSGSRTVFCIYGSGHIDKSHGASGKRNRKSREHTIKTQRESSDIAYSFFNLNAKLKCVVNATLLPLYHPVPFIQVGLNAGQVWYGKRLHP